MNSEHGALHSSSKSHAARCEPPAELPASLASSGEANNSSWHSLQGPRWNGRVHLV